MFPPASSAVPPSGLLLVLLRTQRPALHLDTGAFPQAGLVAPGTTLTYNPFDPGDYDLYLRQNGGTALLSGPTRITLVSEGIYGVLAVNGADTATAGVVLFDDFP